MVFYLILFQPQRHSYDGYSIYMTSFNQFLQVVYPLIKRDRPSTFFMQKINPNSINLYRISTKIGKEMYVNKPFMCTKFQLNQICIFAFYGWNAKCAKQRRNKEIITKLVSRGWVVWFVSNLVCRFSSWGAYLQQIWLNSDKGFRSYIGVKITLQCNCLPVNFLFVLLYSWCGALASWTILGEKLSSVMPLPHQFLYTLTHFVLKKVLIIWLPHDKCHLAPMR